MLSSSPLPSGTQGTPYSTTLQASGGSGSYTWSVVNGTSLPPGLNLDQNSGVISGTPTAGASFSFDVQVSDGSTTASKTFVLTINNTLPTIASLNPNNSNAGTGPITLAVNGTNYVSGSIINWNGAPLSTTPISGAQLTAIVPAVDLTTPGTASVTVVNPAPGGGTSNAMPFTINNPLQITTTSLPNGQIGQPYSAQLQAMGGVKPYTWSLANGTLLPPGLNLDPQSGMITGVPTTAGTFGFTVQVQDSSGLSAVQPISINPPPQSGTAGSGYQQPITITPPASGGSTPTCSNYSVLGGATLPPGLQLDPTTGLISGTPLDGGDFTFVVGCTPSDGGQTVTASFTITINNPLPVITSLDPNSVIAGGPDLILTVNGSGFVQSSVVQWGGTPLTTIYVSETQLTATIPAADIAQTGTIPVTVGNPQPVGGVSNSVPFTVNPANRPPSVTLSGPATANEGDSKTFSFTVNDPDTGDTFSVSSGYPDCGTGGTLVSGSLTTAASGGSFQCQFPDGPANSTVSIQVADSHAAASNIDGVTVSVANVPPTASIHGAPATGSIGTPISLTATATDPSQPDTAAGFTFAWTVSKDGQPYGSPGSGAAFTLAPTAAGSYVVSLTATDKDNGVSQPATASITVPNPAPVLSSLQPSSATAGGVGFMLTLNGSNFVPSSTAQWGSTPLTTTFVSSSMLTVSVPAADIAQPGTVSVTVVTPPPGGGTSSPVPFPINARSTALALGSVATGDYNDPVTLSATLTDTSAAPATPIGGVSITLAIGSQNCTATTNAQGVGSCSITPSVAAGNYPLTAAFAGSGVYAKSSVSGTFTVTLEETTLTLTSAAAQAQGTITLTAQLKEDDASAISGRTVSYTAGSSTGTGTTNSQGVATATLTLQAGQYTVAASFAGDSYYKPSTATTQTLVVYQPTQFVIWGGNQPTLADAIKVGQSCVFWGAQWSKQVTGGDFQGNASFKGYADSVSGTTWTANPGGSSNPPATIAGYISVIVATQITKQGGAISGNIAERVVIKVDSPQDYQPDPGHTGSGTIVAIVPQ